MGRVVLMIAVLSGFWFLLSGYLHKPVLLAAGVFSVLFTTFLSVRARVPGTGGRVAGMFPGIIPYLFRLSVKIGEANLKVARQALAVEPDLSPVLFRVPCAPQTSAGRFLLASSITLTPGTVTVLLENGSVLVHALVDDIADTADIARTGARIVRMEQGGA